MELAEKAGTSQPNINRIEKGQEPKLDLLDRIAVALGTSLSELLGANGVGNAEHIREADAKYLNELEQLAADLRSMQDRLDALIKRQQKS